MPPKKCCHITFFSPSLSPSFGSFISGICRVRRLSIKGIRKHENGQLREIAFSKRWEGGKLGGQIIFIMRKLEKFGMQSFAAIGFKFLLPAVEFSFKHFPALARFKALFLLISHSQHLRAHYRIAYKAEHDSLVYRNSNSYSYRNSYCFSAFPFSPRSP